MTGIYCLRRILLLVALRHQVFGNVDIFYFGCIDLTLGLLKILNIISDHEKKLIIKSSFICRRDVNELFEKLLGQSHFDFGCFHFYSFRPSDGSFV